MAPSTTRPDTEGSCYRGDPLPRSRANPQPYSPEHERANPSPPPHRLPVTVATQYKDPNQDTGNANAYHHDNRIQAGQDLHGQLSAGFQPGGVGVIEYESSHGTASAQSAGAADAQPMRQPPRRSRLRKTSDPSSDVTSSIREPVSIESRWSLADTVD
ncbi:hypothetical protein BJV74DRAFT_799171 [Russula compacta]|nr:hypothetical protein BJV74DRAFT_799171 [Russula compacta]